MKIAIVGGSIAGLECAIRLADHHDVIVYEEHKEIGYPLRCAEGWVRVVEPYGCVVKEIETAIVRELDNNLNVKREYTIDVNGMVTIIDRPKMEKLMAEIAEKKGAEIITGRRVKLSELKGYDLVVDASGYPSLFGSRNNPGIAIEARCEYSCDEMVIDFIPHTDGYFWIFPKGDGTANIGVGFWKKRAKIKPLLEKYIDKIGAKPLWWTAGLLGIGLNKPLLRWYNGTPVALVGDAAGLVDPFFGEGMAKAVISARVLARCVNSGRLKDYEKDLLKELGWALKLFNLTYKFRGLALRFIPITARLHKLIAKIGKKKSNLRQPTEVCKEVHYLMSDCSR